MLFSDKFGDELDVTITPSFTKESDRAIYSFSKDKIVKAKGGKITPKTLTYEAEASNKTYDGKVKAATVKVKTGTTITGIVTGENPEITLSGTFDDKKAGVDKPVTVTATCDDPHYTIGSPTNEVKASISKKEIHVDGKVPEGASFEDGSKVTVNFTLRQSEKVDGDSLSLSKSSCKGTISGAGQNVTVTVNDSD
ncbi:MAG: YDG domain-containing protein [Clostridia bacterium]|nr:YDG domain-containing protein [Clostridia bacterium]